MMKHDAAILVLGHRGLIGSALFRRLVEAGYKNVIGASRPELALEDNNAVEAFFSMVRPEYVFLAAGKVGGITANQQYPADFLVSNLSLQINVFNQAHLHGVKKLIYYGSSCMYPRDAHQPMNESALLTGELEETSLAYAVSKIAGIQMCKAFNAQYGKQCFIPLIPNSVYGPNDNFNPVTGHVISSLIYKFHEAKIYCKDIVEVWGSGRPVREFIYVDDIADASIYMMCLENHENGPFNVGSGEEISIIELARLIAKIVGYKGLIVCNGDRPDGAPRKYLDSQKLKNLGWMPQVTLDDGLLKTYAWYCTEHRNISLHGKT